MRRLRPTPAAAAFLLAALAFPSLGECGSAWPARSSESSGRPPVPGPLVGEAGSAAAGDIPDNQVFVRYSAASFSMKTPEGWAQSRHGAGVVFRDKNNIVRVVVGRGAAPTAAAMRRELALLHGVHVRQQPARVQLPGGRAFKAVYTTTSAPNPVTGKRVTLIVDRYELARGARRAVVDLGTPVGVDNVDAYRLMIQSFRFT
jgi:hypothetical protein